MYKRQIKTSTLDGHNPKIVQTLTNCLQAIADLQLPPGVLSVRIKHSKVGSLVSSLLEMGLWTTIYLGEIFKRGKDKQETSASEYNETAFGAPWSSYSEAFLFFCWLRGEFFNKFRILRYIPVDSAIFSNSNGVIPVANLLMSGTGL